jgi:hypothetical protein
MSRQARRPGSVANDPNGTFSIVVWSNDGYWSPVKVARSSNP